LNGELLFAVYGISQEPGLVYIFVQRFQVTSFAWAGQPQERQEYLHGLRGS